MNRNVFIIHDSYGNPEENWIPWLKVELEKIGCHVFVPKFPTPKNQSLDSWLAVFKEYGHYIQKDTIFIGHSLGPVFLLHILEQLKFSISSAYFVAPFTGDLGNSDFDTISKTFFKNFDWEKIKTHCKKFFIFYSNNDPYVPAMQSINLAKQLDTNARLVEGAGRFNSTVGYLTFPQLLESIKQNILE